MLREIAEEAGIAVELKGLLFADRVLACGSGSAKDNRRQRQSKAENAGCASRPWAAASSTSSMVRVTSSL
jgi:hypothetical protein